MKHKSFIATQRTSLRFLFAVCTLLLITALALPAAAAAAYSGAASTSAVLAEMTATPSAVPAQSSSGIQMTATAAYNGNFKYGEWLPVWVELQNQGGDLDGEIRIQVSTSQGMLIFSAPVTLPAGARKRMPVYVLPNNFSRELEVRLVSGSKAILTTKATVRPQPYITYMIGLLAPERGALSMLNGITFPRQDRPKVIVDLTLDDLTERAEALRSFDLIIINDTDTSKLSPDQASALASWVQKGGRLVIGGGAGAQRTVAGLQPGLLPLAVERTGEVDEQALKDLATFAASDPVVINKPVVAALGTPTESRLVAGSSQQPLVQERAYGEGAVDFVAFDLAGLPFNGWPGTSLFWEALLGPNRAFPENMPFDISPRQYRANALYYPLSNIPSLDLPSIQGISILLIIYILVVGPFNYLILRWRKRMQWAWITIPVITLLFTGLAFGIGYGMRGNDLILNKISVIELRRDGTAGVTSYMGLFSPRMQSYEVNVQGESLISPMNNYDSGPWNSSGQPMTNNEMTLVQGQPSKVKGLTVNQWAMQSFMAEDNWKDFGKITGNLRLENDTLVGTVRNESQYTLTDVIVTFQSRFVRLDNMAPGEERPVDMGLSNLQSDRFSSPLSYRIYQEKYMNQQMPRDVEQKSNIISTLFENNYFSKFSGGFNPNSMLNGAGTGNGPVVFGWIDQAPPEVNVPDNRLSQRTTALVYTTLDYTLPESGYITLPPGMVPGGTAKMPQDAGTCGSPTSIHMTHGEAEFEYQIPGNLQGLSVNTLKVAIWRDNGMMNGIGMPTISLWNWKDESWSSIQDPIQGTNIVPSAAPYVNADGQVRVQISTQTDTVGCVYIDLGIEAESRSAGKGS